MRIVAVDTNSYSALIRNHEKVVRILRSADRLVFPFIVVGELLAGFRLGNREQQNRAALQEVLAIPETTILYADNETSEHYAAIFAELRRSGTPIPTNDIWIAALARQHSLPVCSLDKHLTFVKGITVVGAE